MDMADGARFNPSNEITLTSDEAFDVLAALGDARHLLTRLGDLNLTVQLQLEDAEALLLNKLDP